MNQEEPLSIYFLLKLIKKGVPCRLDIYDCGKKKYLFILPNDDSKIGSNGVYCHLYIQGDIIVVEDNGLFDHRTDHVYFSESAEYDKVMSISILSNSEFNKVKKDYEAMAAKLEESKRQVVEEFKQYIRP